MQKPRKALAGVVLTTLLATVFGNLFFSTRDVVMTVGQSSYEPDQIVDNRLWTEVPMQILHTHMADSTRFIGVGLEGEGGLPFSNRLVFNFGSDQVEQSQPPFDLRDLPESDLQALETFIQELSYRSLQVCPHDPTTLCTIAIGWNRERTKERNMLMVVTRVRDNVYLIVDDSIINVEGISN